MADQLAFTVPRGSPQPRSLPIAFAVAAIVLSTGACGSGATASPSPPPRLIVVDKITKPSIEGDRVVFAVLLEADGPLPFELSANVAWTVSALTWLGQQSGPSGLPAGSLTPRVLQDMCPASYPPPEWKQLDSAHPDSIQPAAPIPLMEAAFKGWVSWQLETRPDCELFMQLSLVRSDGTRTGEIADFQWTGQAADLPAPTPEPTPSPTPPTPPMDAELLAALEGGRYQTRESGQFTAPPDGVWVRWFVGEGKPGLCAIDASIVGDDGTSSRLVIRAGLDPDTGGEIHIPPGDTILDGEMTAGEHYRLRGQGGGCIWSIEVIG